MWRKELDESRPTPGGDLSRVGDDPQRTHAFGKGRRYDPRIMCRTIKTLFNFDPPATDEEIRDASAQFVQKLSGFTKPSKANAAAFDRAVDDVTVLARRLIDSLVTTAAPRDREGFAERARVRAQARFGVRAG